MSIVSLHRKRKKPCLTVLPCVIAAFLIFSMGPSYLFAVGTPQESFTSPEEAVKSLVAAVRTGDIQKLLVILGPGSRSLISSGDDAADKVSRDRFLRAFDQKNSLERASAGKMLLHIGADDWSLPVPIVKKGPAWVFDTLAGKQEILNRRIGRNELRVMDVLYAYVDAQHEFATRDCKGAGRVEFAQKIISSEGKHDGLYWKAEEGEEISPLGPLVAQASKEGYANAELSPFHGYYFKILKGQGKHAIGGAYNYVVKGKMLLGFALLAYPAQYGNSGVMSFMVNQEGIVYEKKLGYDTKRVAEQMKVFDPDKTWKKVINISIQKDK